MCTTAYQLEDLTIHEENRPKPSDDNPAVIIPGHLQVSNADFAHLTFGSFVSGTLDASCSMMPANTPAMPPFRELDPAFSLLLTNPPLATMVHGTPQSSVNNATVPSQPQEV